MSKTTLMAIAGIIVATMVSAQNSEPPNKLELISGGFIDKPIPEGSKIVLIVDSRTTNTNDFLSKFSQRLAIIHHVPHKIVKADYASLDNAKGDVILAIVDSGEYVVYPKKHLAVVPVEKENMEKILTSALVAVLGVGSEQANAKAIAAGTKALGIPNLFRTTYKNALEQGWAPAPITEAQKSAYEKFQAKNATATNAPAATPPAK